MRKRAAYRLPGLENFSETPGFKARVNGIFVKRLGA
jgi:hypothetical protein